MNNKCILPKTLLSFILVMALLTGQLSLVAQSAISVIDINKIPLSDTILSRCLAFTDSLGDTNQPNPVFQNNFSPITKKSLTGKQIDHSLCLQFHLRNSGTETNVVYFFPGLYFDSIILYKTTSFNNKTEIIPQVFPRELTDSIAYRKILLGAGEQATYYARLHFVNTSINNINPCIIRDYYINSFSNLLKTPSNKTHIISYIIVGILAMMIIYSMAVFILNGTMEFFYYAVFATFMAIMFFIKSYLYGTSIKFNHFFESYFDMLLLSIATFFYLVFIKKFINTPTAFPFLGKLFNVVIAVTMAGTIFFTLFYFTNASYNWLYRTEILLKCCWAACAAVFITYAFFNRDNLLRYLAVGHLLYLAGIIIAILLMQGINLFKAKKDSIFSDSLFFTELGLTLELICFLLALAFKNRKYLIDRTRERERLKMDNERKELEKQLAIIQAKQEERNRISTDMHDELGSGVTAIRLMSEIMRSKMKDTIFPEVDKISNSANELHSKMNTIIWTMSSSNDRLDNLIAYVRSHALEYLENTNMDCHFINPENISPMEISGEKRRNIYLCIKETLNNTVKYSKASKVWIEVAILLTELKITVQDNGIGINKEKLRNFGNGLNNMKKRMESINGSFTIENSNGTLSIFIIPL